MMPIERCQIHPGERWLDCDQAVTDTSLGIHVCAFHAARLRRWINAGKPTAAQSIEAARKALGMPTRWDRPDSTWQHAGTATPQRERVPGEDDE